jgi:hypothetical protein
MAQKGLSGAHAQSRSAAASASRRTGIAYMLRMNYYCSESSVSRSPLGPREPL